jgi:hypothetical protein
LVSGSLLVAALAERFVRGDVESRTAEIEAGAAVAEHELLAELAAVQERLRRIEFALRARTS